ncbi:MAG: hypothetical protein WKF92_09365 [Pyrinomonadaceae bacterium]
MSEKFNAEFCDSYIHVKHSPGFVITPGAIENIWVQFAEMGAKYECGKFLVEAREVKREINTMQAFDSGVKVSAIRPRLTVALCFPNYKHDKLSEFFITVAHNREVNVKFFDNIETAKKWLGVDQAAKHSDDPA